MPVLNDFQALLAKVTDCATAASVIQNEMNTLNTDLTTVAAQVKKILVPGISD